MLGNNVFNYLQKRGFILLKDISDCIDDAVLYQVITEIVKLCSNLVRRYSCDTFEYVPVNLKFAKLGMSNFRCNLWWFCFCQFGRWRCSIKSGGGWYWITCRMC